MSSLALSSWLVRQWTARFRRDAPARAKIDGIDTTRWTLELLRRIEWRRFGALCGAYFEALGRRSEAAGAATEAGFGFTLQAEGAGAASLVQCTAWSAGALGVPAVRALRAAMTGGAIGDGVLVTPGKFTHDARALAAKEGIRLIDGAGLIAEFAALAPAQSAALLRLATQGEFLTPTCPRCDIKMAMRQSIRAGRKHWGCINYPRCKHTFFGSAHAPQ